MNLTIPQLVEWDNYYQRPDDKVRMCLQLTNPKDFIDNQAALCHDFYYFSDEFTVLFNPLVVDSTIHILVEGPHENPSGERIPILSSWTHLKVNLSDCKPHPTQYNFAFYNNKWWEANLIYDYYNQTRAFPVAQEFSAVGIDITAYCPSYWCYCNKDGPIYLPLGHYDFDRDGNKVYNTTGHRFYDIRKQHYTLFKEETKTDLWHLVDLWQKGELDAYMIGDWLIDRRGDPFGNYVLSSTKGYVTPEVQHMCESIKIAKNDRAAKLLLLANGVRR
jgi:hypothetical protein